MRDSVDRRLLDRWLCRRRIGYKTEIDPSAGLRWPRLREAAEETAVVLTDF